MSIFVGIDPGMTGAIGIIDIAEDSITTWDMPLVIARNGKNQLNIPALADMLRSVQAKMQERQGSLAKGPKPIKLEAVHAMPKQGVTSSFNFGMGYGAIQGVIQTLGMPMQLVTPQKWKRAAGLIGADKDYARTLALQLWPDADLDRKKDIGRADALLIARYG